MNVIGLDLSLRRTGIATGHGVRTVPTDGLTGMERIDAITDVVRAQLDDNTYVVLEGYAHGSPYGAHALGELGGVVRYGLFVQAVPWTNIAPTALKKYATGSGKATKERVVANARERLGYHGFDNNEADALWLRAIGLDLLGVPVAAVPKVNRSAIAGIVPPQACLGGHVDVPTGGYL